jgi:hypothetical protein
MTPPETAEVLLGYGAKEQKRTHGVNITGTNRANSKAEIAAAISRPNKGD